MDINQILTLLKKYKSGLRTEEILSLLRLKHSQHGRLRAELSGLRKDGLLAMSGGRYLLASSRGLVRGRFSTNRRGFGFVIPADGSPDVFVPARFAAGVMNGDEVEAAVREEGKFGKPEGRIIRVLREARTSFIGIYAERGGAPFIQAFDMPTSDLVPLKALPARPVGNGNLVEVDRRTMTINKVFGPPDAPGVDVEVIVSRFNLRREFPPEVLEEAGACPDAVPLRAIEGRTDFRGWPTVTIDGEKARDFDDAVSIKKLPGGRFLLGVHIADVSHYIREGSELDKEARLRGTSVYFPDMTLPMLPEKLSNGLCSLKPGVNRLAFSVLMEIDPKGRVVKSDFMKSVIKTAARMTYTSVSAILEGDRKEHARYKALVPDLLLMKEAAAALRSLHVREGSLDLDLDEPELVYEEGRLKSVVAAEHNEAHQLIEEFMVAANVAVASHLSALDIPVIYRIHPAPSPADLEKLRLLLARFGYYLPEDRPIGPFDLQAVLRRAKGRPEEKFVTIQVLHSMKTATYAAGNVGHYGLAKTDYTHFTSPIRRYPDLIVHRVLQAVLAGWPRSGEGLEAMAGQCSDRERNADSAEQSILEWRIFRLLKERLGDVFDGVVIDMNKSGLIIELKDYFVDGLLPFEVLDGPPEAGRKRGRPSPVPRQPRRIYALGEEVRVVLSSVDPVFQRMTFVPASSD